MTEIEIDYKPPVFHDPEYCNSGAKVKCRYLESDWCGLFIDVLDTNYTTFELATKCDECKSWWREAKTG